ncbi:MAG TPA: hypothetical protein VK588_13835, partial [Chitinophagaceae bacterium]|nr:hypothetical protein [Chitinophagaceae bacterium]
MMDIKPLIQVLLNWKNNVEQEIKIEDVFLFGSPINTDGLLFDSKTSDIDIVILMPDNLTNAVERTVWLTKLKNHKPDLELAFTKLLKRKQTDKAIVSIISITQRELKADIHKSAERDFFSDNIFYNIVSGSRREGIVQETEILLENDITRQLFESCQLIRNKYLAVGIIEEKKLLEWQSETDVAPKELMRICAKAAYLENGKKNKEEKTDLKIGFSHLTNYVFSRRFEDDRYQSLNNWLGKRSLRKGEQPPLEDVDYLFISEMIFDMASSLGSQTPIKQVKQDVGQDLMQQIDTSKPIEVSFKIGLNGLIVGSEEEIYAEIMNAGINLGWRTSPYYEVTMDELAVLHEQILKNSKDGKAVDKFRKLSIIKNELIKGYCYIIYYQNYLFRGSSDMLKDILTAMRKYTLTRYANVLLDTHFRGATEGFLQASLPDYGSLQYQFPNIKIKTVLNFGIPDKELDKYLKNNKALNKKYPNADYMALAAFNQPIISLNTNLLANFFVPLLVQRLVEYGIDPLSEDKETREFT